MKTDLATSIVIAIAGVLVAYFVCNLFVGEIKPVTVKTIDTTVSTDLAEPDPEIFNYQALNPTVEVYVGNDQASTTSNQGDANNQGNTDNQGNE